MGIKQGLSDGKKIVNTNRIVEDPFKIDKNDKTNYPLEEPLDYDIEIDARIDNEDDFLQENDMTKLFNSPFRIKPGTMPPTPGYKVLNKYEYVFFNRLKNELLSENIKSDCVLTRLSYGTFNVDSNNCYVGKVRLRPVCINREYPVFTPGSDKALRIFKSRRHADTYCKILSQATVECRKIGNKRFAVLIPGEAKALRLFETENEACDFKNELQQAYIRDSSKKEEFYMQYQISEYKSKDVHVEDFNVLLALLPFWIKRIKKCDKRRLY